MKNIHRAIIALIVANIIWGAASPIFKWSLQNIEPFTLAFIRFAIASIILLPFVIKNLKIEKKDILIIFGLSIVGIGVHIPLFLLGLKYTQSINAPIIGSSAPIFIILISIPIFREKLKIKKLLGALLGLFGVSFLFLKPIFQNGIDANALGNILLIAATFAGIAYIVLAKEIMEKYKVITVLFYTFLIGTLTLAPLFLYENSKNNFLATLNYQGIIGIVFGALLSSALAYYLFYWALKKLSASDVSLFTYIDPIIAILIAIPLLQEIPSFTYLVGTIFVFLGIYIAEGHLPYHHYKKLDRHSDN